MVGFFIFVTGCIREKDLKLFVGCSAEEALHTVKVDYIKVVEAYACRFPNK